MTEYDVIKDRFDVVPDEEEAAEEPRRRGRRRIGENGLNETELRVVEALVHRGKKTYREVAKELGLSERHFRRIRDNPAVKEAVKARTIEVMAEEIPGVIDALVRQAKRGNMNAITLFLKMNGMYTEKSEIVQTIRNDNYEEMSDAELDAELEALKNEVLGSNVIDIRKAR